MSLNLHTIKKASGVNKKRKRIGRGNAAGQGTYSGKGLKGQKSRSGVSNLKRMGMKQSLLRTPKKRGFKSSKPKNQIIKFSQLNDNFKDKDKISPKILYKLGLINDVNAPVKLLGGYELELTGLILSNIKLSASAKKQFVGKKGKIIA